MGGGQSSQNTFVVSEVPEDRWATLTMIQIHFHGQVCKLGTAAWSLVMFLCRIFVSYLWTFSILRDLVGMRAPCGFHRTCQREITVDMVSKMQGT